MMEQNTKKVKKIYEPVAVSVNVFREADIICKTSVGVDYDWASGDNEFNDGFSDEV